MGETSHPPRCYRQSVLAVHGPGGPIGTGTVIGDGIALTALHVVAPKQLGQLGLGPVTEERGVLPVWGAATVPLESYGSWISLARRSHERAQRLTGSDEGTVDLALLIVPGLRAPAIPLRSDPVRFGEYVIVPGYPGGQWSITRGPIIGQDEADFTVHLLLGPGASGSPALDHAGRLAGLVTLDNEAGTICIGPALLTAFFALSAAMYRSWAR